MSHIALFKRSEPAHDVARDGFVELPKDRDDIASVAHIHLVQPAHRRSSLQIAVGILMTLGIVVLAFLKRAWLLEAISLTRTAQLNWLVLGAATILISFLISSQVFQVVLHTLGHRLGMIRLWATAMVAVVISQVIPGGGIGSYAFLLNNVRRHGVSASEATFVATLETLSYTVAMIIFALFGLTYLASRILVADPNGSSLLAPLLSVSAVCILVCSLMLVLTRIDDTLRRWLQRLHDLTVHLVHRSYDDTWIDRTIVEWMRVRALVAARWGMLAVLVLIQFTALSGHSLGLYFLLRSLGTTTSFLTVLAAFGIALLTSTINVIPGGGGTVEAALVTVLTNLGIGAAAVPGAIVFRLLNFWVMLPIAAMCYAWLMRHRSAKSMG